MYERRRYRPRPGDMVQRRDWGTSQLLADVYEVIEYRPDWPDKGWLIRGLYETLSVPSEMLERHNPCECRGCLQARDRARLLATDEWEERYRMGGDFRQAVDLLVEQIKQLPIQDGDDIAAAVMAVIRYREQNARPLIVADD